MLSLKFAIGGIIVLRFDVPSSSFSCILSLLPFFSKGDHEKGKRMSSVRQSKMKIRVKASFRWGRGPRSQFGMEII